MAERLPTTGVRFSPPGSIGSSEWVGDEKHQQPRLDTTEEIMSRGHAVLHELQRNKRTTRNESRVQSFIVLEAGATGRNGVRTGKKTLRRWWYWKRRRFVR